MKQIKILGLAALAAMALIACIGASSASATVLCKTNLTTGCAAAGWDYAAGTEVNLSLEAETTFILFNTSGVMEDTCTVSAMKGSTSTTGGASETVKVGIAAGNVSFSNCQQTTDVLEGGELEVHNIAGGSNGTLTARGFAFTYNLLGVCCTYSAGTEADIGTVTGGSMATVDIHATFSKIKGPLLCPSDALWEEKDTVTSPEPLFISAS